MWEANCGATIVASTLEIFVKLAACERSASLKGCYFEIPNSRFYWQTELESIYRTVLYSILES